MDKKLAGADIDFWFFDDGSDQVGDLRGTFFLGGKFYRILKNHFYISLGLITHDSHRDVSFMWIGSVLPKKDALPESQVTFSFV